MDPSRSPPFRVQTNAAGFDLSADWPFLAIQQGQGELSTRLRFQRNQVVFHSTFCTFFFFFFFILFTLCLQTRLVLWRRPKKPFYHFYLAFLHFWELLQSYDNWFLVGWVWHLAVIWVAVEPKGFQVSLTKQLKTTPDWHCPCFFSFSPKMHLSEGSNLPHFPCHFSILKLWLLAFN